MLRGITVTVDMAAALFFTDYWIRGRWPRLLSFVVSMAAEISACFVMSIVCPSLVFACAMAAGILGSLIFDFFCCERRAILPKLLTHLSIAAALSPLTLCGDEVWEYAVYQAAFLLCLAITPLSLGRKPKDEAQADDINVRSNEKYGKFFWLPCAVVIPQTLLLTVVKDMSAAAGLAFSTLLLLFFILLCLLQREADRRIRAEQLNDSMNQWQKESRDYMNTIRSQRHDYNLHLHAVSGLINSGEYEKCRRYVEDLVSQANDVNDIMSIRDPVVGSMLYNMREKARRQGTDIQYHITYGMEDISCNGFECNKIIGNLLQNAIDALQTPEDKACGIRLNILKRRGNTVIISENRFTGDADDIARAFELGYSTKKNHEGLGLSMVLRTVQQYGGRVYPEFEENIIRFVVNIPNKVRSLKEDDGI